MQVWRGDLVEVFDISRNEWCLVRPVGRPADQEDEEEVEGWVPASFLKPYREGGFGKLVMLPQILLSYLYMHTSHIYMFMHTHITMSCIFMYTCKPWPRGVHVRY